ncbi:group II intron maturase-specific domain-containing protein [Nostoc sp.]|uniref:group II intron maturase-specific domain-containing protein n=1 Tax=Nostoc sp. TaxID=1180 RepID=UPI003592EC45
MQKLRDKLRRVWLENKTLSVDALIAKLNPIIRGSANYFRIGVSSETFDSLLKRG